MDRILTVIPISTRLCDRDESGGDIHHEMSVMRLWSQCVEECTNENHRIVVEHSHASIPNMKLNLVHDSIVGLAVEL